MRLHRRNISPPPPRNLRIVGWLDVMEVMYCNDLGLDVEPCVSFELIESALSLEQSGDSVRGVSRRKSTKC